MEEKKRKIPVRRCTGCGNHFEKRALVRIVRTPEGEIKLDLTGKLNGRGADICRSTQCLKKAEKQKRLESVLDCQIPREIYEGLFEEFSSENM